MYLGNLRVNSYYQRCRTRVCSPVGRLETSRREVYRGSLTPVQTSRGLTLLKISYSPVGDETLVHAG